MGKYNIERISQLIRIGWDGENNWRPQTFDCSSLLATRPSGTVTLWILPNGESEAFPVALTADGNLRTWTPLDSELVGGSGKLQFHCQSGTDIGKSPVYRYVVEGSILTGAEHPGETPSWAVQVVEDVTEAAGHYPHIGENGNWFVWDYTEGEFVDTGVSAGGGEISPEDVAEAVEDYFDEHPVVVTETDPTVPAWAKQPSKPTYTAQEVGALPDDTVIPPAVTEQTVSGWGFTKNTGTYSKPSGGIPKTDLADDVQTSLGKADTALQQHQSLAAYRTSAAQDIIDAAQDTAINAKYTKPSGGIPDSDIASAATWNAKGTYSKPSGGIPASDLASGVIPSVPAMASELDMSDWDNGKTVDAAVLAADFTAALTSLNAVAARLEALADSDDTTLDQLSEIVAYIKNNKSLIDGVTTSKVSVTDIVNSLVSTETGKPLSAAQGRALKALIDAIVVPTAVSQLTNDEGFQTAAQVQTAVSGKEDETETVTKTAADTSATLQENKFYIWPEMTALTITCPATGGPYAFRFTSGATATTLTMTGITMPDGFSVEANTVYEINVYEGYGLAVSWEVSA